MRKALALSILSVGLLFAGCGGGSKHTTTPAALSLTASATLPSAGMGAAYSQTLTVTGGTAPYTWSVAAGSNLPAGLALNASTGAITGTPTAAGAFTFSITVTDSSTPALSATAAYTLSISQAPVVISTTTLPAVLQGVAYSQTLAATGGTSPYTWTVATGATLPDGLTLSTAGVLSGTPTTAGAYSFSVTVADSSTPSLTATQALTLSVTAPIAPLAITTTSLPAANVNFAYTATLAATGGVAPYTWTLVTGTVQGLTLDAASGVYSGTPAFPTSASLLLEVTDSVGANATVTLPFAVSPLGMLKGTYFFQVNSVLTTAATGVSTDAFAETIAGSLVLDGQGHITGGSVDYVDDDGDYFQSAGLSGEYLLESFLPQDNTVIGLIGLTIPGLPLTSSSGPNYEFILTAGARQQPGSGYDTTATLSQGYYDQQTLTEASFGSGSMKLQDPTAFSAFLAQPTVNFGWKGDTCELCGALTQAVDLAAAGVLTFDSNNALTGSSLADIATGSETDNSVALSGALSKDVTVAGSNTDTNFNLFGRSTLSLSATGYTSGNLPSSMILYVIDSTHAYALTGVANAAPLLSGFLQAQTSTPALSGSFLTWGTSQDAADSSAAYTSFTASDAAITLYTAASGALSGSAAIDNAGVTSTLATAANFTVGGNGRVLITPTDSNPAPVFWLSGVDTGWGVTQPTGSNGLTASLLTLEPMTVNTPSAATISGTYFGGTAGSSSYNAYFQASLTVADGVSAWNGLDLLTSFGTQQDTFANLTGSYTVQPDGSGVLTQTAADGSSNVLFTDNSPLYVVAPNRILVLDESASDYPTITLYQQ